MIGLVLVLVASWSIGNITYLFPNLGEGGTQHGFTPDGNDIEVFDISVYLLLLFFFILGISVLILYIYNKYGKEVLTTPFAMVGMVILAGIIFLLVGSFPTGAVIAMTVVGVISFAFIADKRGWARINIVGVCVILLISIPVIYQFSQAYTPGVIIEDTGSGRLSRIGESGKELVKGVTGIGEDNLGLIVISSLILLIAFMALIPKVISYFRSDDYEKKEKTEIEKDLSESVDRAIRDLNKGKDIRSTIIRCYQKMCFTLEDYGVIYDRYMTPREFEENAVTNLNLSRETISDLTTTFEEARYSSHQLSESQRKAALKNLRSLKREMG